MNRAILLLGTLSLMVICAECRSPQKCTGTCDQSRCAPIPDSASGCGTYLDGCNCCSYPRKCPGEQCSIVAREKCAEGYKCKQEEGLHGPDRFNKPGICVKED